MATKTARDLAPAHGDLETAVVLMARRYAEAESDWRANLYTGHPGDATRLRRAANRRFQAMCRLTAALAHR